MKNMETVSVFFHEIIKTLEMKPAKAFRQASLCSLTQKYKNTQSLLYKCKNNTQSLL